MRANSSSNWFSRLKAKTIGMVSMAIAVCFLAVSCAGGSGGGSTPVAAAGIAPDIVADYIHAVMEADRTAYTKHVINRLKTLEGKDKPDGVIDVEATESWQQTDGIPLPAQMFRLGSEIASDGSPFTYQLLSSWYINDNHEPRTEFEKTAIQSIVDTGEPYKEYQEVAGKPYFSALYPDKAVAEACVTCHNTHPTHLERYPDKVFEMGDVMGGIIINIPLDEAA